jgi:monoamine oxidase
VYEINGEQWLARDNQLAPSAALWQRADQIFGQMALVGDTDCSFQTFLARFQRDPAWQDAAALAASYVAGFDAAGISTVSVQALIHEQRAAAARDGDRAFRIAHGYDQLVAALAAGGDRVTTQLGLIAQRVVWRRGYVEIHSQHADGSGQVSFNARRAVITLPLGVLQAPVGARGAVAFHPPLADHAEAARRLAMGQVVKITFRFRERFWEHARLPLATTAMDARQISFITRSSGVIPTWWTAYPAIVPQITAWAGGTAATRLVEQPEHALIDQALDALAALLSVPRGRIDGALIATHTHNWHADPFARGAYSYIMVNGMDAVRAIAAPIEDTLFLAGEATNTDGHTGTVHGAMATGRRAARAILSRAAHT